MVDIDFLHGGNIYEIKRRYKKEVIDFSANINPLGFPSKIKKTIKKNIDSVLHYPDPEHDGVTQRIAQYWGIGKDSILPGNGSVELIYLIMNTFRPKAVTIPIPTFSEYERAAALLKNTENRIQKTEPPTHPYPSRGEGKGGGQGQCPNNIKYFILNKDNNFEINPDEFITAMREERCDMAFLCNPNNPTGRLLKKNGALKIAETAKELKCYLVIDEAFMDFLPDEKDYTLIWKAPKNERIIVLRTFTKFFAIPGLRVGYIVTHPETVKILKKYQPPWSVNVLAQLSAETVLADSRYIENTRSFIEKERKFLLKEISKTEGLFPYPSVTNFLLVRVENKGLPSSLLTKKLLQRGILVRDCANFRGLNDKFIRIAVRSHKENLSLIKALREVI